MKQLATPIVQENGYWLAKDMQATDLEEIKGREVLSKDFMHGFVAPEMGPFLQTDLDLLVGWAALAKQDKTLAAFYQTQVDRTVAEYRASGSINGMVRRITGSPIGQTFDAPQHGYMGPEEIPQQQGQKGGLLDFLKGKKVVGDQQGAQISVGQSNNAGGKW